jgi:NlpC/P60 family putative phage cell wall peptidase
MNPRDDVVAHARRWLGTPYRHQASVHGAGADCLGLIRGVWRDLYGSEPETPPPYSRDWAEVGGDEVLWAGAERHLVEKDPDQMARGDTLLFRMRDGMVAKHLGILSDDGPVPRFIHSYARHGVIESALSWPWRRRVVACFSFPGGNS